MIGGDVHSGTIAIPAGPGWGEEDTYPSLVMSFKPTAQFNSELAANRDCEFIAGVMNSPALHQSDFGTIAWSSAVDGGESFALVGEGTITFDLGGIAPFFDEYIGQTFYSVPYYPWNFSRFIGLIYFNDSTAVSITVTAHSVGDSDLGGGEYSVGGVGGFDIAVSAYEVPGGVGHVTEAWPNLSVEIGETGGGVTEFWNVVPSSSLEVTGNWLYSINGDWFAEYKPECGGIGPTPPEPPSAEGEAFAFAAPRNDEPVTQRIVRPALKTLLPYCNHTFPIGAFLR